MDEPEIHEALEPLGPEEIEATRRFIDRLEEAGILPPAAAHRWRLALHRSPARRRPQLRVERRARARLDAPL